MVGVYFRDRRIILRHPVEHHLGGQHLGAEVPQAQGRAGIGARQVPDGGIQHQFDVIPIVPPQDVHKVIARLGQLLAAPLGQSIAFCGGAVAEFCAQRLYKAHPADIVVEKFVHHLADGLKDVPSPG